MWRSENLVHPRAVSGDIETDLLRVAFESATVGIVCLDAHGRILDVNPALCAMAEQTRPAHEAELLRAGTDYLALCRAADPPHGAALADGIEALLRGERARFDTEYASHSASEPRWFMLQARPGRGEVAVVLTVSDVSDAHIAEARSRIQACVAEAFTSRTPLATSCGALARVTCEQLVWDFTAVWMLDPPSCTLRCVHTWMRAELAALEFERACRGARLAPGVGLPGRAWASRTAMWVTDRDIEPARACEPASKARTIMAPSALAAGFRSGFAFPVRFEDDVLAVIEIFGRVRHARDDKFLRLLELSTAQLATAELRDRAERRAEAAQLEANAAREQLEAVLDCVPVRILAVDRSGAIQFVNRPLGKRSKAECVGMSWRETVPAVRQQGFDAAWARVLESGTPQVFDLSAPGEDGRLHWFTHHIGPMRGVQGITGAVLVSQDVTEFRRAHDELIAAQRLAAIGTLAAGIAHEINTPLQFIGDNIEFLREAGGALSRAFVELQALRREAQAQDASSRLRQLADAASAVEQEADLSYVLEELPSALERCVEGLERVTTIVRSMKEFSHPAQKEMVTADLNRAIAATLTVARNEYKYIADLETDFGALPAVKCHVNEINQVVLNILVNAAHAIADHNRDSGRRGLITVRTRAEADHVLISIADTGGGIPESIQHRIFEPFFTTKEVGRGTGQGLAIAWTTIKEKHQGELSFETTPGEGTVFSIKLPLRA